MWLYANGFFLLAAKPFMLSPKLSSNSLAKETRDLAAVFMIPGLTTLLDTGAELAAAGSLEVEDGAELAAASLEAAAAVEEPPSAFFSALSFFLNHSWILVLAF